MIIKIKVFPRAKHNQIKPEKDILKIYTSAPAVDNKANEAVMEMLADFYKIKKRQLVIKKGERSRQKIIEIIA
jgi:uncharacterized protein (TIGR00251 family)